MSCRSSKGTKVGLGWFDPGDPTDRAVAEFTARALRRRGLRPLLVGPRRRAAGPRRMRLGGAPLVLFDGRRAAAELGAWAREAGVSNWRLHLFGRDSSAFLSAAEAGRWRLVTVMHLVLADYLRHAGGRAALLRAARLGPLAAVSRAQRREAAGLSPRLAAGLRVVPPCGPSLPRLKSRRGKAPTILCASRLAPYKGVDLLLMAFARLGGAGSGARLILAGRDQSGGALQSFADRLGLDASAAFVGELSRMRLARLLADCAAFVLPSRRDNAPMALLEAMAAGKPVVAARVGGVPELVAHGRSGLLVPPGDPAALARALARVLGDAGLRRRLGAGARRRARRFTWDAAAGAVEELARRA